MSPDTLKAGIPPGHAAGIATLKLCVGEEDYIEEWIDAIASLFPSVTQLWVSPTPELARMRRHYILYQLPKLESIDGVGVTDLERQAVSPENDHVNSISIKEQQQKQQEKLEKNNNNKNNDKDVPVNSVDDTVGVSETTNDTPDEVSANTVNDDKALSSENKAENLGEKVDENKDAENVESTAVSAESSEGEEVPSGVVSSSSSVNSSSQTKKVPPPSSFGHGKVADI